MKYSCERIFCVNPTETALKALPAYEENSDKYLFLHNCAPSGLLEDWGGDFEAMEKNLLEAMPAFAYWLLNDYVLPEWATRDTNRHTVADYGYMSPIVLQSLSELDEAGDLMARLRKCYVNPLTQERVRNKALTQEELRSIMEWLESRTDRTSSIKMGFLLSERIRRWPHLIEDKLVNGYRHFTLLLNEAWLNPLTMNTSHCAIAQPDPILLEQAGLPHDFNPVPPRHAPKQQDKLPLCA